MDWRRAVVPAAALLPLRAFFGVTFLYAGLDKLLDPAFFDPDSASSIQAQFLIFERSSPLAPLIHATEPFAVAVGGLIALGEIAVGLGAISGLAFRLAALGGAVISMIFFLTASWTTRPYYFGNDLPYALGWLTLALAGHGNLFVFGLARFAPTVETRTDTTRRGLLQVGALAFVTLFVGGGAALLRFIRNEPPPAGIGSLPTPGPSPTPGASRTPEPSASAAASGEPSPSPTATSAPGIAIARVSDLNGAAARRFTVPITAPAPLPAGDPGVLVALGGGKFAAYDALCTHEGCRVGYDSLSGTIVCPCHGAQFDPADHGAVLGGPAPSPLVEFPLIVNAQDGTIALALR
jgi:thiosulfate dehydrogenase [quinone] large subunit